MADRQKLAGILRLARTDRVDEAEKALIALIRDEPDNRAAYAMLARVLMRQNKVDYAVRAADKAAELAPMEANAAVLAGFTRLRAGDRTEAAVSFRDALAIDGKSTSAILGAASLQITEENYQEALDLCEKAVALDPSLRRAQRLIIRINLKQGRNEEALAALEKLIARGEVGQRAVRTYIRLMRDEGRLDEALENVKNVARESDRASAMFSRLAERSGRPDMAIKEYRRLIESGDARPRDRLRYVSLLVQTGALDEARKAVSDLPDRAFVKPFRQKLLGDIARADGQAEAALAHFGKACKLARAEGLREDSRSAKLSAEDRAAAWATHTGQALQSALQSWRDERRRRPDKGSGDNS